MQFHFIEIGSGSPLLFLHGIGGNAETWQYQLPYFAKDYRVIAVDLPGYGRSDPLPKMTFPALAQWLHELLVTYNLEKTLLVGHSFGGMIVQEYLATYNSDATAIVLYGTSPAFGRKEGAWQQKFVRGRLQPLDDGQTMRDLAPSIAKGLVGSGAKPAGIVLAERGIAAVPDDTFRDSVLCLVDFDQRANLGQIKIPCLVLAGEEDRNAPSPMMKKMAGQIPAAEFVSLPQLGHMAHLESPALFNDTLQTFFKKHPGIADRLTGSIT